MSNKAGRKMQARGTRVPEAPEIPQASDTADVDLTTAPAEQPAPPAEPQPVLPSDFDEQLYLVLNPDVEDAVKAGAFQSGAHHWLTTTRPGQPPEHRCTITHEQHYALPAAAAVAPSAEEYAAFDVDAYLSANLDIQKSVGGNREAGFDHWLRYGRFENRVISNEVPMRHRSTDMVALLEKPFGVNFFAPFSAQSGLGTAARGYLRALRAAGIPTALINLDFSPGHLRVAARDYEVAGRYRINLIQVNADTVGRFFRLFHPRVFNDSYNVAIWAWELNVLRPDWFRSFVGFDEVWTLSDFNSDAVRPVSPVPVLTVNPVALPAPGTVSFGRDHFNLPEGFLFLAPFDVGSSLVRKNPSAVLAAFAERFAGRDDVHLVLKFHSGRHDVSSIRALLTQARGMANVHVRSEVLSDAEMRGLQSCCDCLVSAHRSEGFGLNIAEFMLTGRPVIVTGYSGNMDFTTAENSYLLPYRVQPLDRASGPYLPGYLWAEPDVEALGAVMARVVAEPAEAAAIGAAGAAAVRERLSADAIGRQIAERFTVLGLDTASLPPFMRGIGRSTALTDPAAGIVQPLTEPVQLAAMPTISVITPVYNVPPEYLAACIESVRAQSYGRWELCLCDDASTRADTRAVLESYQGTDPRIRIRRLAENQGIAGASNAAVSMATGGWLLMLDNDDTLTPDALETIAAALIRDPGIDALYSDEDKIDASGRFCDTYHKPDWSPEHLESVMYTLHPLTVRTSLFLRLGGFRAEYSGAQDWDLMLRVSRETEAIHHVPKILYHWRMIPGSTSAEVDAKPEALTAGARALADHVRAKYDAEATAEPAPLAGHYRVRHAVHGTPPVTLLITTDNASLELPDRPRFNMVENLVASIREHTDYPDYRIVVIDNANTPPKLARAFRKDGVVLRSFNGPRDRFNYPDKANFGLRQVETEQLVVLNDDMQVTHAEWLRALLEFSQQPSIGACGGKLLHADGTIQHVGTVLGVGGGSAHVYHGFPGEYVGYNGFTHVIRNYSALTGACLATRRSVLNELGGWDPKLAVDYNDIDLCLRMRMHGYRLVYTPYSSMIHFESKTAIRTSQDPGEVTLFSRRWAALLANDPYYNPNLSRTRHDFSLA